MNSASSATLTKLVGFICPSYIHPQIDPFKQSPVAFLPHVSDAYSTKELILGTPIIDNRTVGSMTE